MRVTSPVTPELTLCLLKRPRLALAHLHSLHKSSKRRANRYLLQISFTQLNAKMPFTLPSLPYDYSALEPHIDATTMQIHHSKHHNTYVTNVNNALQKFPELNGLGIEDLNSAVGTSKIPTEIATAVRCYACRQDTSTTYSPNFTLILYVMACRNSGGGHYNHR